jgi:phytoene dehydrogenase-like protein
MTRTPQSITVIVAAINGLVAASDLMRAGHQATLLERNDRLGSACASASCFAK